jgi:hypothetical protein
MAIKLNKNTRPASQSKVWEMKLKGMNTSKILNHVPNIKNLKDSVHDGSSSPFIKFITRRKREEFLWPERPPWPFSRSGEFSELVMDDWKKVFHVVNFGTFC